MTKYMEEHSFIFDNAYDEKTTNLNIYNNNVKPLVEGAFKGAKVTFFAYGQTGAGKTYTIQGSNIDEEVFGQNDSGTNIQRSMTGYSGTSIG